MALFLKDYGLLGDTQSAALVGRDGSIDWLCFPRFDSGAVFAALLGTEQHGRWLLAPTGAVVATRRRYQGDTLILETEMDTEDGTVRLIDFMPPRGEAADVVRAIAGDPAEVQIMYGVAGERRLPEYVADWLPGYDGNPVRIGNDAVNQFQLDVYGEVMDALYQARTMGDSGGDNTWALQRSLMKIVSERWREPDEGIWEVRGGRQHFTHSKLMAWVAVDRAVRSVEKFGLNGPVQQWRELRDEIRADIIGHGFDTRRGTFTQYYGSTELDAALLMIPLVGFLPADDERVRGTVAAIENELLVDGYVQRYSQTLENTADGLPPGEGAFLACTFWLADNYSLVGRTNEATAVFERLLALRNDLGLLSEEYDPRSARLVGNFPQAFSHIPLINTARNLSTRGGPSHQREKTTEAGQQSTERR